MVQALQRVRQRPLSAGLDLAEHQGRILVGDDVVDGYSRSGIRKALTDNGYPMEQLAAGGVSEQTAEVSADGELTDDALDSLTNVFDDEAFTEGELESEEFEPEEGPIIEIQAE